MSVKSPTFRAEVKLIQGDTNASKGIEEGILCISQFLIRVFMDLGSTHSFISYDFALRFIVKPQPLDYKLFVATPIGYSIMIKFMCHSSYFNKGA